jgi:hypothetical protein
MIISDSRKEPACRSLRRAYAGWDLGRNGEERKLGVAGWLLPGENFLHEETPPVEKPTSFDMVIFKYTKKLLQPAHNNLFESQLFYHFVMILKQTQIIGIIIPWHPRFRDRVFFGFGFVLCVIIATLRSFTRGIRQIWIQVREENTNISAYSYILAIYRNLLFKYGDFREKNPWYVFLPKLFP